MASLTADGEPEHSIVTSAGPPKASVTCLMLSFVKFSCTCTDAHKLWRASSWRRSSLISGWKRRKRPFSLFPRLFTSNCETSPNKLLYLSSNWVCIFNQLINRLINKSISSQNGEFYQQQQESRTCHADVAGPESSCGLHHHRSQWTCSDIEATAAAIKIRAKDGSRDHHLPSISRRR